MRDKILVIKGAREIIYIYKRNYKKKNSIKTKTKKESTIKIENHS